MRVFFYSNAANPLEPRTGNRLLSVVFFTQHEEQMSMGLWLVIVFVLGLMCGMLTNRRFRRDRIVWAQRRLQLKVLSLELKSLRQKVVPAQGLCTPPANRRLVRKRPCLKGWQKTLIAWLHRYFPWSTDFMGFSPMTLVRWLQGKSRKGHAGKIATGKSRGHPPTPQFIVNAIVAIKNDNPRYGVNKISSMISGGELQFSITKRTVADILKAHGFKPGPKGKDIPREEEPGWIETLYNQFVMALDFKVVLDLSGNSLYILNIIDHGRRVLIWSRATYNPTAEWVAQQLRNALMDLDTLPEAIVMDRDSILRPIAKHTLPNMGIKPIRIGYKCPWQNAVVERFHGTLSHELLRYVQPLNDRHLNRLLRDYREYYNRARPHMANGVEPPSPPDVSDNPAVTDPEFFKTPRKIVRKKWLGGLHSSYRWAAKLSSNKRSVDLWSSVPTAEALSCLKFLL